MPPDNAQDWIMLKIGFQDSSNLVYSVYRDSSNDGGASMKVSHQARSDRIIESDRDHPVVCSRGRAYNEVLDAVPRSNKPAFFGVLAHSF